jgi:hypothetical protein
VSLDLTRPEHREALRWAAEMYVDDMARVRAWLDNALPPGQCGKRTDYLRALSSPSESAAIVRALLEGCGVEVDDFKFIKTRLTLWECAGEIYFEDPKRWGPDPRWPAASLRMRDVPALILALLDCTECRGVKVNGARYGCRKSEPRIGDARACPTCDDTGVAKTQEARDGAIAALREAGR